MTDQCSKLIDLCKEDHENSEILVCRMCRSPNVVLTKDSVSRIYFTQCNICDSSKSLHYNTLYIPVNYRSGEVKCKWVKVELD